MTTTTINNTITISDEQKNMGALKMALFLSITAPTDEKAEHCVRMAEGFAAALSDEQIEICKAAALEEIEAGGCGDRFAEEMQVTIH